jgi:menaquinone-dependent protoporphyrinogen oxidase
MSTLILYTTKYGNTTKCAEALAKKLKGQVDVKPLTDNMPELNGYDTVVLGGSMYAGKMQKAMVSFAGTFLDTLLSKKIALFVCCMSEEFGENQIKSSFPEALVNHAVAYARLGGGFTFSKMKGMDKFIMKMVTKAEAKKKGVPVNTDYTTDRFTLSEEAVDKLAAALNA